MADSRSLSVFSAITSTTTDYDFEINFEELSYDELYDHIQQIIYHNELLLAENRLLENYTRRLEETKGQIVLPSEKVASKSSSVTSSRSSLQSGDSSNTDIRSSLRKRSRTRTLGAERNQTLSQYQKSYIVNEELIFMKRKLEEVKLDGQTSLDNLQAKIQEADISLSEVTKASTEFYDDIRKGGKHPMTGKIRGEKVERYFEDTIKSKQTLTEKLRMRGIIEKAQCAKIIKDIKEKEEVGERIKEVDFKTISIENEKCKEMLKERNEELLRMKSKTNVVLRVLTDYRKQLDIERNLINHIVKQTEWHLQLIRSMDSELEFINKEKDTLREKAEIVEKDPRHSTAPSVMKYATLTHDVDELQKEVDMWKKKVNIAEQTKKFHEKTGTR